MISLNWIIHTGRRSALLLMLFWVSLATVPVWAQPATVYLDGATEQQITTLLSMLDRGESIDAVVINVRDVNFEFGSDRLDPETTQYLDYIVRLLERVETIDLRITGHTDNAGAADFNRALSLRRAQNVKAYLISHNVPDDRMVTEGFGEDAPITSNETEAGRAKNRRVAFSIIKRAQVVFVQDLLITVNADTLGGVVLEVGDTSIGFRRFVDDVVVTVDKDTIDRIIYSDGRVVIIERAPEPAPVVSPDPPPRERTPAHLGFTLKLYGGYVALYVGAPIFARRSQHVTPAGFARRPRRQGRF